MMIKKGMSALKVNIQKHSKRFIPLVTAFFVLVVSVGFPIVASAEGVDYKDYISNIEVDGHNDIVTITVPANDQYWTFETGGIVQRFDQGWVDFAPVVGQQYTLQLHPFNGRLNLDDIPNGTIFTVGFSFQFSNTVSYDSTYVSCNEQYYSSSGSWLGQIQNGVGHKTFEGVNTYSITSKFSKNGPYSNGVTTPAGSVDLFLQLYKFTPTESSNYVHFNAQDFTMTFTISSLYELQQTQERTNELLEAVEDKLEENGQKLDDIINGTPEQNEQADQFQEEISGSIEDLNQAGEALNQVPQPSISPDDLVPGDILAGNSFLAYTFTLQELWKSKELSLIFTTLGGLMVLSFVLFGKKG